MFDHYVYIMNKQEIVKKIKSTTCKNSIKDHIHVFVSM